MKDYYKNNILFQEDWFDLMSSFSDEEFGKTLRIVFGTIFKGEEHDLSNVTPMEKMVIDFILPKIESAKEKYAEKCKRNRESAKARWEKMAKVYAESTDNKEDMQSDANACDGMRTHTDACEHMQSDANACGIILKDKDKDTDRDTDKDRDSNIVYSNEYTPSKADASDAKKDEEFENLWVEYGRIGSKKKAKLKYERLSKKDKLAVKEYIPYYNAFTDPHFKMHFITFLNQAQWENILHDTNGKEIPYGKDEKGQPLYRVADVSKFKTWFNKKVQGSKIPQVDTVEAERLVNLNVCYTLYPQEMNSALKVVLNDGYYIAMANKGSLTFDKIFDPRNITKICERGKADGILR